jgi:nicotinamidase/pyrazinamidase
MGTIPNERNVLVAVDVQNDFFDGSLAVTDGAGVVAPLNRVAESIRKTGGQVIFTRDWHPETTPHFDKWPVHCVADTPGAEFSPALHVESTDSIVSKGIGQTDGYSGWEGITDDGETLEQLIEPSSADEQVRVFIGGLATDFCVRATALDIAERFADDPSVDLLLLRDAIRAVNLQPGDGDKALEEIKTAQYLAITTDEARTIIQETAR